MKKLMQVFVSVMIATSTFGGVTSVAAKENTPNPGSRVALIVSGRKHGKFSRENIYSLDFLLLFHHGKSKNNLKKVALSLAFRCDEIPQ